jgi:hypothetical protein
MPIKKHPEWKLKYPAVDGFGYNTEKEMEELEKKHPGEFFGETRFKKPIRSDIEKILGLNDEDFTKWFSDRKITALRLLKEYEIIGTIPSLNYGFEDQQYNMTAMTHLNDTIGVLKESIEYLDVIKQVRDEYKKGE